MRNELLIIDPGKENEKIVRFIKKTLAKAKFDKVILGLSGGVDSATCLFLLAKALPKKNIIAVYLPYKQKKEKEIKKIIAASKIPRKNFFIVGIKSIVDEIEIAGGITQQEKDRVRLGNVMARVRMIILYDLAKKYNALVCGTENKSEHLLGYFTRFGDEASDFEPIRYLYKTQVNQIANFLGVAEEIIEQKPTAGLWEGQTDEGEFGFTYEEADPILSCYFDKKLSLEEIKEMGFSNVDAIINRVKKNDYKRKTPYLPE